jgi:deoxyadenosine/deoxycytidine kinase
MIVIEGPDGSGKSTFIDYLRKKLNKTVIKPYYPKVNQLSYYLHSGPLYSKSILERYYLSEVVYPRFKGNREPMEDWKQFLIEASLFQYSPVIIYLRPSRETIIENIETRGDDYVNTEEVDKMLAEYDGAINRSFIPSFRYDYKTDDPYILFMNALEIHYKNYDKSEYFHQFLSSGDCLTEGGVMFIGEDPSNKSVGDGYIRAFISDKGSPAFLHKALWKAGVYDKEMPYFTNYGKGFEIESEKQSALSREIDRLKPRKIVCLGKETHDKIGIGEWINHPSYVKRFSINNYEWYINDIKNIFA